ncbi:MAG: UDP-N-acetyl glucosamine 2-epimerase [Candidatus Zixiibacteriota bacterium]
MPRHLTQSVARRVRRSRPVVVTVFGTRPQFIKLSVLWEALESRFRSILIDSGQHYDFALSGSFHSETGLRRPDIHLGLGSAAAAGQIGRLAQRLDRLFPRLAPDAVIVVGDTSTTAGAALAAAYRNIPLAHVEAGLRSFDLSTPEEKNRVLADHLATWRFCPSRAAIANLSREGIDRGVYGVGDLMYENWRKWQFDIPSLGEIGQWGLKPRECYFLTCHRAQNVDEPDRLRRLVRILYGLDRDTVFAVHPRARKNLQRLGLWAKLARCRHLRLAPPLPHRAALALIANSRAVLTDSGGIQREAYWARTPCLVLRASTEWNELVECGAGVLTDLDLDRVQRALARRRRIRPLDDRCFGYRRPSSRIARCLESALDSQA